MILQKKIQKIIINCAFLLLIGGSECYSPFSNKKKHIPVAAESSFVGATSTEGLYDPFSVIYQWRVLDFQYPNYQERQKAIASGEYIVENNLPLGIERWQDRIFITMPRWKPGVPISLAWLPLPPEEKSPAMRPYPNWSFHTTPTNPDCSKLMSVYRLFIDDCGRLWVLDAGVVNATILINPICLPKIMVFNLANDELLLQYELPDNQVKQDSLHTNLVVDIRDGQCEDAHAYITDVWRNGIVVFSWAKKRSWRTINHLYLPNPQASDYNLHGLNFQWTDGVFGITLAPIDEFGDRLLFFHPMSSFQEFIVSTSVLRNESLWQGPWGSVPTAFQLLGDRGERGQSSTTGLDRNGVMFFNLVTRDSVGCWNIRKPYIAENLGIVAQNSTTLVFPNDLRVDHEIEQNVWVLSNRLPIYLYSTLNYNDINFRIQSANVKDAVKGTVCE